MVDILLGLEKNIQCPVDIHQKSLKMQISERAWRGDYRSQGEEATRWRRQRNNPPEQGVQLTELSVHSLQVYGLCALFWNYIHFEAELYCR